MRILSILSSTAFYGKERSNIEVYNLMRANNHEIRIVQNKLACDELKKYTSDFYCYNITCPCRFIRKFRILRFILEFIISNTTLALILLRYRPQVLMMNSEKDFYDLAPILSLYTGRIIYRMGDAPCYEGVSGYWYNSRIWKSLICKKVNTVVCISKYIMNELQQHGRHNVNDTVIYNYPPARKQCDIDESSLYKDKTGLVFGYIGQIFEPKGLTPLLEAAIRFLSEGNKAKFYIAGSLTYDKVYANQLLASVPESFKANIHFIGEVHDLKLFFQNIDVLCVPSIKEEPLGNVIVEAKMYSTPCMIFPSGGMPELIKHKEDGYICKEKSAECLYEGMCYYEKRDTLEPVIDFINKSVIDMGLTRVEFEKKWNIICLY